MQVAQGEIRGGIRVARREPQRDRLIRQQGERIVAKAPRDIRLDGQRVHIGNPRDAIAAGICLLTEDRKSQGLMMPAKMLVPTSRI